MARCPQNKGKGKGGPRPTSSGFTGWTVPAPAPVGQLSAGAAIDRAPWNDEVLDAPRAAFSAFMVGNIHANPAHSDPNWANDPWLQSSGFQLRVSPFAAVQSQLPLNPWATYQTRPVQPPSAFAPAPTLPRHPTGSPVASMSPVGPQVDPEDELSDSQHDEQIAADTPVANPVPATRSYVGLPIGAPLHLRSGEQSMSEQQIMAILHGQMLAQPTRSPPPRPPAAQRLRNHNLPLSVASSLSHQSCSNTTLVPPPAQAAVGYTRAVQAIEMTRALREGRRGERADTAQPSPSGAISSASSTPMPSLVPNTPDAAGTPQATEETQRR